MTETLRPNIRIEIQNDLVESMDVDDKFVEDGEINEPEDVTVLEQQKVERQSHRIWPNSNGGFSTGINIFDKIEQTKLLERAKRFSLKPDEICNFTDEQLQELHDSLGIMTEDEKDIRFEALHMRGTDELSTEDVLEYFAKYGPSGVEWINDESCNILFDDKVSAARALFFLSKPINGMPVEGPCDPFAKELDNNKENGKSILLKSRTVELKNDSQEVISVSDLKVAIPPGYWRIGIHHLKSRCILLRFALKSDKKQLGAEKFSEYYKKYGNPNYGGMKGLISESQKRKFKGIFEEVDDSKNPWGTLARNWNEDVHQREKEVISTVPAKGKSDIMSRIGYKRGLEDEPTKEEGKDKQRTKIPRMRMYADEEEEKIKRKKELQKFKSNLMEQQSKDDLRDVLKSQMRKNIKVEREDRELEPDLGLKLKNRIKNIKKEEDLEEQKKAKKLAEKHHSKEDQREASRHKPDDIKRRHRTPERYSRRMRSDEYPKQKSDYEDQMDVHKPRSKVAVVIKTQKRPTVASTVWSRITADRERLKTVSEGKLRRRSTSSESDSSDSSSSSNSSDADSGEETVKVKAEPLDKGRRPGFHVNLMQRLHMVDHRSPLRIEINNDHFKKE